MDIFFSDHKCCKRHIAPEFYLEPLSQAMAVKRLSNLFSRWHSFIQQNKSSFWLGGGSLLGAMRNQSIIPWDDDVDVGMLSSDFSNLINTLSLHHPTTSCGEWINIYETDTEVFRISPNWQNICLEKNSAYWVDAKFIDKVSGLWVDVFVYHPYEEDSLIRKFPLKNELPIFDRAVFLPLTNIQFEGYDTFAPHKAVYYLRLLYGQILTNPDHKYVDGFWTHI